MIGSEAGLPVVRALGALVILIWGVVVVTNVRGIADAMPTRGGFGPFWQETSPAAIRLVFGFFALWGGALLAATAYQALR